MESWNNVEKQMVDIKYQSWTRLLQCYGILKSTFFACEFLPLSLIHIDPIKTFKSQNRQWRLEEISRLKQILNEVWLLIQQDSERISAGIYPAKVLHPEWAKEHWLHLLQIWIQGYQSYLGVKARPKFNSQELDMEEMESLRDVSVHYRQHQKYAGNTFLDPHSISIYEHQMEMIYLGSVDAMRRLILAPMKKHFRYSEGEGLKFLEIGCGSGRMTRFIKAAFPKAKITVLDASPIYLKAAQKNLKNYSRIDFIQGDALDLPFKDECFDVVYSSFLLHEFSLEVRKKVLSEARRVLNSKGWVGLVDLIQIDDCRELNWILEQNWFIGDEPHIKEYSRNNLVGILKHFQFEEVGMERGFLGKVVFGSKNKT